MLKLTEPLPWVHRVNVEQAMETLDYADMMRLAETFHDWAFNEDALNSDQRTRFLLLSVDYERIAESCGPEWTANSPNGEEDVIVFLARILREERPTTPSPNGKKVEEPSAREFLDSFANCMENIISQNDDPEGLMYEILVDAERAGIIDAMGSIRTKNSSLFVRDLLTDNPSAFEWAQFARERTDPKAIKDSEQLLNAIYA